jgi:hypothetical protein
MILQSFAYFCGDATPMKILTNDCLLGARQPVVPAMLANNDAFSSQPLSQNTQYSSKKAWRFHKFAISRASQKVVECHISCVRIQGGTIENNIHEQEELVAGHSGFGACRERAGPRTRRDCR